MKRFGKRFLCGILTACILSSVLCSFASADVRSSAYISSYAATVTAESGGEMVVTVDISGVGYMSQIGATKIYMYESTDNKSFYRVATYNYEDYPNMMSSGTFYFKDAATYNGTPGYYYYASVYCYAGNSSGGDERNYTTSIVRAIP